MLCMILGFLVVWVPEQAVLSLQMPMQMQMSEPLLVEHEGSVSVVTMTMYNKDDCGGPVLDMRAVGEIRKE